jgi:hypothetical protein
VASDFAKIYYEFLKDMKATGVKTDSVAMVHDNTEYGTSVASVITSVFKENGQNAPLDIAYAPMQPTCRARCCSSRKRNPTS